MRKKEREIRDFADIVDVLRRCDTVRMGICGGEYPYVVPLSFGYEVADGKLVLYVHGAGEGKKHDLLARSNRVCVEADLCHRFVDTGVSVTAEYESVIGYGTAEKAAGADAEKGIALLLEHCGFAGHPCSPEAFPNLTVYRIALESVTGKRRMI
ncbi:MAG TPA: pyridoxamine 5'-phosphate oxidase family protein [Oscillospiraceae bacterium]|nr:pyridoxamine 5'-phosphate oxidase family protein [Oscillospiraceae bacterium]